MDEQLISEPIRPEAESFDTAAMARGEPGVPRRFRWREADYEVAEVLERTKDTRPCTHGSGERYVGRHWFRVRTTTGEEMRLYFERNPRPDRRGSQRWFLYGLFEQRAEETTTMVNLVLRHFDRMLATGLANVGPDPCRMWMASLDTRTGGTPADPTRPDRIPRRHYRAIDAPGGASLYWDQPALVAAHALSRITGETRYAEAADAYVADFLDRCVARNGVFLWGNHYYWHASDGRTVFFKGEETPRPVDVESEDGWLHETRPIPPAWELFRRVSPGQTEREIRASAARSLFDAQSGGFNRHADGRRGCAFLESGGILVESLAWLHARTGDASLIETADRIVGFSFRHRSASTGLVENNPTQERWDKLAATTEIGLWGGCLIRAAEHCGRRDWIDKADAAVSAYLDRGYDAATNRYWGRLLVADGAPVIGSLRTPGDKDLSVKHQPDDYADIWRPLFPAHDYPMPLAECCLALYERTGKERYALACERWAGIIRAALPARGGQGAYAEHYGRCIHFLWRCGRAFGDASLTESARAVAREAVEVLFDDGMFRSHPGEHRCDAVDGVGFLTLALLALGTDREPDMMGTGW